MDVNQLLSTRHFGLQYVGSFRGADSFAGRDGVPGAKGHNCRDAGRCLCNTTFVMIGIFSLGSPCSLNTLYLFMSLFTADGRGWKTLESRNVQVKGGVASHSQVIGRKERRGAKAARAKV